MGWEVVKQPGSVPARFARFSTVVMSNTHANLGRDEMIALLVREYQMSDAEARAMINAAPVAAHTAPYRSGRL